MPRMIYYRNKTEIDLNSFHAYKQNSSFKSLSFIRNKIRSWVSICYFNPNKQYTTCSKILVKSICKLMFKQFRAEHNHPCLFDYIGSISRYHM